MSGNLKVIAVLMTGAVAVCALSAGCGIGMRATRCAAVESDTGKQTKHTVLGGCFVKLGGQWVPYERWRAVE